MRHLTKLISATTMAATLGACVYVNDASSDVVDTNREAHLEGGSYKAMLPNDPTFKTVADLATMAAYAAAPTRALVENVSVFQAANGDYLAHVTMTGGDGGSKYRLVVVDRDIDGNFTSKGVIVH